MGGARDVLCTCSQTPIYRHPDLAHKEVYGKKFPALRHFNLTSPSICRHSGTISGFDSKQVLTFWRRNYFF